MHNESFVSERQKGIFECEFCGTQVTRSFDLTRHKSKCKFAPAITSTSQTVTTLTFLEPKPTTSSGAVEESATLVDQGAALETFVPETPERGSPADESPRFSNDESLHFKLETLASLGERSEVSSEETLTGTTEAVDVQERAEDSEKTPPRTTEVAVEEQLDTAVEGVASYSTNFSSLPPNGVKVGSVEFQQHVFATALPTTNDFDVLNVDDIRSKFCNGSPSKPVVVRQCTNKLPGIATPPAESLTSFRCVTKGIPRKVKINVCFSAIQENEDEFTLEEFLEHNEDRSLQPEYHPMNVIDFNADAKSGMVHRFCLPNLVTDISFGHCMKASLSPKNQLAFDFTSGISDYLLMSEAGAQTNWHQDFTGTSVFYILAKGQKHFFVVEPTEEHQKLFEEWLASGSKK